MTIHPPPDRLPMGVLLLVAATVHGVLLFATNFQIPRPTATPPPRELNIVLVHHRDPEKPPKAEFLAQANQAGGAERPTQKSQPTASPVSSPRQLPRQQPAPRQAPQVPAAAPPKPKPPRTEVTTRSPRARPTAPRHQAPPPKPPTPVRPDATRLIALSLDGARLSALVDDDTRAASSQIRSRTLTARTQEYQYASYMKAWERKVERIGTLNYPEDEQRHKLSGTLRLDVTLLPNGQVKDMRVVRSSGNRRLDAAALSIVRLAAPFARFPTEIRKQVDQLHIMRTWQFDDRRKLFAD